MCFRIYMFVCGGVLVRVYTVSPNQQIRALDVSKLIRSSSVLHTACYITCAIPTTTVTRVGPPLRQRYIASKHLTCKHTSKRSVSRSLAIVLITVQLVVYHKR